jgi:DeoR/GlpR family transcriptional regulator of sugar metabolism
MMAGHDSIRESVVYDAAAMVRDGDSLLLDASPLCMTLAHLLLGRRRLTVVTNSVDVGCIVVQEASHSVRLLGGVMDPGGNLITGERVRQDLATLDVDTAYLCCDGVSVDRGLVDCDPRQAQIKRWMIQAARRSVLMLTAACIDSRQDAAPFAQLGDIDTIVTDAPMTSPVLQVAMQIGVTVCTRHIAD